MQIACPCGKKNFEVDASLIPEEGRLLQCGFCSHKWFYINEKTLNHNLSIKPSPSIKISKETDIPKDTEIIIKQAEDDIKRPKEKKIDLSSELINKNTKISKDQNVIGKILSYLVIGIISFIALIVLLDTFKIPLNAVFPKLDYFLTSLYETLKDIELFIIDLI